MPNKWFVNGKQYLGIDSPYYVHFSEGAGSFKTRRVSVKTKNYDPIVDYPEFKETQDFPNVLQGMLDEEVKDLKNPTTEISDAPEFPDLI